MSVTLSKLELLLAQLQNPNKAAQEQAAYDLVAAVVSPEEEKEILDSVGFKSTAKPFVPRVDVSSYDAFMKKHKAFIDAKRKKNQQIIMASLAGIIGIGTAIATGGFSPSLIAGLINSVKNIFGAVSADAQDTDFIPEASE
jgi:hypothetical protein